ncbi:hypothetical protein PV755_44460 [Streptomyces caniscabiei]|uniref:hypothetical protein n=1 Tax=Streptomyces caniscabiei TaxID=2746961 RepID=UPI0029B44658|nr:hypothetical protein [Streptomyces caniscabiei]MDX3515875.1 hypothetical protein [Streptomyces caniscabiei]MDX3725055.1 hypothetical protein [Streptomyces caniscabiei]
MGFREPDSTITVRFKPGEPYHGLEATLHSLSIDEYATGMAWYDGDGWGDGETIDRFYKALISWNLTDEKDQPIPVSEARSRDQRLIRVLNRAWLQAMVGIHDADPLPENSPSGETSPAPPIPMMPVAESQSQAS